MRTKNEELHKRRKSEILRAATKCFSAKGIRQATMQEICAAVNISPGSLYRYYASKDDIITALAESYRQENEALLEHLRSSDDLLTAMRQAIPEIVNYISDPATASFSVEIVAEAARNPDVAAPFLVGERRFKESLVEIIKTGQERGQVDTSVDAAGFVHLFVNLLDAICGSFAFPVSVSKSQITKSFDDMIVRTLSVRD